MSALTKIKAFYRFVKPTRYKVAVLLVVVLGMLLKVEEKYIETTAPGGKPGLIHLQSIGKPVVYLLKDETDGKFYPLQALKLLAFAYAVTLVFYGLFLLLGRVLLSGGFRQRLRAFVYLVVACGLPYFALLLVGNDLLVDAVHERRQVYARFLVRLGVNPNRLTLNDLDFPLQQAAYNRDAAMSDWLLRVGADPAMANSQGRTALHTAVERNAICVARLLLGAPPCNVTQRGRRRQYAKANVNAKDTMGNTPLHLVRHPALAALLVRHGADVNATNRRGQTPLFTVHGVRLKKLLLRHGAKATHLDREGNTALHFAKSPAEVRLLVKAGIDVNHRNRRGKTALHLLVESSKLKKHGDVLVYEVISGDALNRHGAMSGLIAALIASGADVDLQDKDGMSAVYYAVRYCLPAKKLGSRPEAGRLLFAASREVRAQLANRQLSGRLAQVVADDKLGCWNRFVRKKPPEPAAKKGKR